MLRKNFLLPAFILVALVQLYVPARMILDQELVLKTGKEFKFKTAPIDPNDPFRGKYITLQFDATLITVQNAADWQMGEKIFVEVEADSLGFAKAQAVFKEKPPQGQDFVTAKVSFVIADPLPEMMIEYPFNRFYLEESKAPDAELIYREAQVDTNQVAYALVCVKEGKSVLKDVLIDGVPIREMIKNERAGQ